MKKAVIIALCSSFLFSMLGCSSGSNSAQLQRDYLQQLEQGGYYVDPQLLAAFSLASPSVSPSMSALTLSPSPSASPGSAPEASAVPEEASSSASSAEANNNDIPFDSQSAKIFYDQYAPADFVLSNIAFGMRPEAIQYSFGAPTILGKNVYSYSVKILDREGILNCYFDEDTGALSQITFNSLLSSEESSSNANVYIAFNDTLEKLNQQYALPVVSVLHRVWPLSQEQQEQLLSSSSFVQNSHAKNAEYLSAYNLPTLYWEHGLTNSENLDLNLFSANTEALSIDLNQVSDAAATPSSAPETEASAAPELSESPRISPSPEASASNSPDVSASPVPALESASPSTSSDIDVASNSSTLASDSDSSISNDENNSLLQLLSNNQNGLGDQMLSFLNGGARLTYLWSTEKADITLELQYNEDSESTLSYMMLSWTPSDQPKFLSELVQRFKADFAVSTGIAPETLAELNSANTQLTHIALNHSFDENALAAEMLYENKAIVVQGQIAAIYRDKEGYPCIRFQQEQSNGVDLPPIVARFSNDSETVNQLIQLKKGNVINVAGICLGEKEDQIVLDPCILC